MTTTRTQLVTEGFTVKSTLKNYVVLSPPVAGAFKARPYKSTDFRSYYRSLNFPIIVQHGTTKNTIKWKVDIDKLNHNHVLPLLFDGLSEGEHPFALIASQGAIDMINHIGPKVLPLVPALIMPIQRAMRTRNRRVICHTCKVLQSLVKVVGEALVPYFRHILPILDMFKRVNISTGDGIDYGQWKNEYIGEVIQETLQMLEIYGGKDAYNSIKYTVPGYESCVIHTEAYHAKHPVSLPALHISGVKANLFTREKSTRKPLPLPITANTWSTTQDLGGNKPQSSLTPASKTTKFNSSSKVTGDSETYHAQHPVSLPPLEIRGVKANLFTREKSTRKPLTLPSTAKPRSTTQDLGGNKPQNCLTPASKTTKFNSSSKVTGGSETYHAQHPVSLPPLEIRGVKATLFTREKSTRKPLTLPSTAKPRSTTQDLGGNKPQNCLTPASKTTKFNSSSKVTGGSETYHAQHPVSLPPLEIRGVKAREKSTRKPLPLPSTTKTKKKSTKKNLGGNKPRKC